MQSHVQHQFHEFIKSGSKVILTASLSQYEAILHLYPASDNWSAICITTSLNRAEKPPINVGLRHEEFCDFELVFVVIHLPNITQQI